MTNARKVQEADKGPHHLATEPYRVGDIVHADETKSRKRFTTEFLKVDERLSVWKLVDQIVWYRYSGDSQESNFRYL